MPALLDDAFYPVLLSSIVEPLTRAEIDAYFAKLIELADSGIRTGRKHVVIVTSDATKFGAASRKQVADAHSRLMTAERDAVMMAAFVPIDNAFVRGAVTALRWLAPDIVKHIHLVSSLEIALREALQVLELSGNPFVGDCVALRRVLSSATPATRR